MAPAKLMRISLKIGVGESLRFLSKNMGLASQVLKRGSFEGERIVGDLIPHLSDSSYGIRGLHINTFNEVERTARWMQHLVDSRVR